MDNLRQPSVFFSPIMQSAVMVKLETTLRAVAPKQVIVTLIGESGTGKEVLARRVHELSDRRSGPFIPINCAAIPEALFESELFGHEKGAFTGASDRAKGKIEAASGGTLFLDEVGEMPFAMQAKLLRFLENHRFMRVGGTVKMDADVRIVFATLRPLEEDVRQGRFRADLYYRIQGVTLHIPALRERRADVQPLLDYFLAQMSARHGVAPPQLGRRVRELLLAHSWPGNVRELRNVVEVLCLLHPGKAIQPPDLPPGVLQSVSSRRVASSLVVDLDQSLDAIIEQVKAAVLLAEGGHQTRAAQRLGVSVRTMQRHAALEGAGTSEKRRRATEEKPGPMAERRTRRLTSSG